MNPNLIILIIGSLNVIMGVSIFIMGNTITSQAFIPSLINSESLIVGTLLHEAIASQIVAIGVILLILKDVSFEVAKNSNWSCISNQALFYARGDSSVTSYNFTNFTYDSCILCIKNC